MRVTATVTCRFVLLTIALSTLAQTAVAQSGRSWMNGFVFADSDTNGLAGALVELIGDQNNDRLKSVRLNTKAENDGKYSLKDVPYGDYTFWVTADGYEPYEIKLYIGSDMLTEIHVKLRRKK
jgi:Carboxypeptidase regulatory-like domain